VFGCKSESTEDTVGPAQPDKLNLFKQHSDQYATPKKPKLIEIAPALYLAAKGTGGPGGEGFQECVGALYGLAYTLKFACKVAGRDFVVCKLEALYGIDGQDHAELSKLPVEQWKWKMLIRVPGFIDDDQLAAARSSLLERGKEGTFDSVKLEAIDEGPCVQMLHVGPYDKEIETIRQMRAFMEGQGLQSHRWHHEVYLSDPRRVPPERLRTILRQPVRQLSRG